MTHAVEVQIMGHKYTIRTDDDPELVQRAAAMIQAQIDELRRAGAAVASDRLLLLVAMNLAGELLHKEKAAWHDVEHLISSLDEVVSQAEGLAKAPLH
ncbi:MAG: cell division protein ZapA [Zetaproteobacteria bacterium]|nr:MAG: cell division protein ZapA [Zetaproteobacteria bacterium]